MDSFCNVFLEKKFIKCISKKDNTCYLFVGRIHSIKKVINKIKKNKKQKNEHFQDIDDEEINLLYGYLIPKDKENYDIEFQKEYLRRTMVLDWEDLIFVYETINEDDTNERILHKNIYNCYPKDSLLTTPYLYARYHDSMKEKDIPL